jgi:hypothetical protein
MRKCLVMLFFVAACSGAESDVPVAERSADEFDFISLHWPLDIPEPDARVCLILGTGEEIPLDPDPILGMADFEMARVRDQLPQVVVRLTQEGADRLGTITRENIGRRLALVVDDQVVALPLIRAEVTAGELDLMPVASSEEAERFADRINHALWSSGSDS